MTRKNCWEAMLCGREPGGPAVSELGVCLAALPGENDGVNGGTHRGRSCWTVTGTLCGGEVQGTFARKLVSCLSCEFLRAVEKECGREFVLMPAAPQKS